MGCRVLVVPRATQDLREILLYVSSHDAAAAHRLRSHLVKSVKLLRTLPRAGRIVPEFKINTIRELIRRPYRIIYRYNDSAEVIQILRFWHSARGTPSL